MKRLGAIDIGTNSVLLTIAQCSSEGPAQLLERATITRLGQGVDRSGVLATEAIERTLRCLRDYQRALGEHDIEHLDVVGTSAMRDARNSEQFISAAQTILGVAPRVVSGIEEASLTFEGALSGLSLQGDIAVIDVGGGSTEFVIGRVGAQPPSTSVSVNIGCVRLTERHLATDPPTATELGDLAQDVEAALVAAPALNRCDHLVAVAGTATTLAALELGLTKYDAPRVHGFRLTARALASWCARLSSMDVAERRALPALEPARADVIVAGALVLRAIVDRSTKTDCVVSDRGVRWGLIERACRRFA